MPRNYIITPNTRVCRKCLEGFYYQKGYGYFCSTWCKEIFFSEFNHGNKQGYVLGCRCSSCKEGRTKKTVGTHKLVCETCGEIYISGTKNKRFCTDKCRNLSTTAKSSVTCDICGVLGYRTRHLNTPYRCKKCRRDNPNHGRGYYMSHRCRCEICVEDVNTYQRDWIRKYYRDTGISYSNGFRKNYEYISVETRLEIFERDGWRCLGCGQDLTLEGLSMYDGRYPTIDHIVCSSWIGTADNSKSNLRSLCRDCNLRRKDDPEGKKLWLKDPQKWENQNKIYTK